MREISRRVGLLAGLLLACCASASALDPSLDISQYAHTAWKIRDGFTKGAISSIAQTPDGYLWLGTEFGLYRFDGVRAVSWQPPSGEHLPNDDIRSLLVARDGTLWIGTFTGLASWKDGRLATYSELKGRSIGRLLQDADGTVWVGLILPGEICAMRGGKAECSGNGSFGGGIYALYEDSRHNLWVAGLTGLWRWAPGPPQRYTFPTGVPFSYALAEDDRGVLVLGTQQGLEQLTGEKVQNYLLQGVPRGTHTSPFRTTDGSLWIGTDQGLLHLHHGKIDKFSAGDGLSGDYFLASFEDREGNVWVATSGGLDRFRGFAIATASLAQGLPNPTVLSVQATAEGDIWVGTMAGLARFEGERVTDYRSEGSLPDGRGGNDKAAASATAGEIASSGLKGGVSSLGLDDQERLWAGSRGAGIAYFANDRFIPVSGIPGDGIAAIVADGHQNLWVLNGFEGLFRVAADLAVQRITSLQPISRGQRYWGTILTDRTQNGLWIASIDGGIVFLKDGHVRASYTNKDGLGWGRVYDLRFDSGGSLWAATQGGLSRTQNGRFITLTTRNGLPCNDVHWSMEDDDHAFWLYMSCGLARIEHSDMTAWVSDPTHVLKPTSSTSRTG